MGGTGFGAHFNRNTHRQVEWVVMAPPRIGPRTLAIAKTDETIPMYFPNLSRGTRVGAITSTMEYIPEAPIPWNARSTILFGIVLANSWTNDAGVSGCAYSPTIELATPQAIENTVKIVRARRIMVFLPSTSLNLA